MKCFSEEGYGGDCESRHVFAIWGENQIESYGRWVFALIICGADVKEHATGAWKDSCRNQHMLTKGEY